MKSDFVSMVTHELRSPVGIIESFAEHMLEETFSEDERKAFLTRIRDNAHRLIGLVNDLLDLSKLELGSVQLSLEEINFGKIAEQCVSGIQMLASKKNVEVKCLISKGFPDQVTADPNRIEQVLINLLSNAVKFTPEKGQITVSLDMEGSNVQCTVTDTGTGMPKNALEKIFNKFEQIHNTESRQKGGTGLGLAVVKTIIEAHQGKIRCESEIGKGSRFIFTIPKSLKSKADIYGSNP